MRIGIDIRSLIEPWPSGVSEYTKQIIKYLLAMDKENEYLLFYNSAAYLPAATSSLFKQVQIKEFHYPSKVFNSSVFFLNYPKIDRLLGGVDILFMPNYNFAAVSRQTKLVLTVHDVSYKFKSFYSPKGYLWHKFIGINKLLRQAKKIISVSDSTRQDIISTYGIDPNKIITIPLGVDCNQFNQVTRTQVEEYKKRYNLSDNFILYFANVEKRKNIQGLLKAWQQIRSDIKDNTELVVAGRIADKKLHQGQPDVRYLGYVPEQEKPILYKSAGMFIYPSYYEGFGLPVIEALAAGLPVITSFSTSLPEVGQGAVLLVDPNNYYEVARSIEILKTDISLQKKLIAKGQQLIKNYSWEKTALATLNIFKEIKQL
ncbi:glycosyltransferase family 4 protein [Patescibacteria group bacterium]|nr:glycosyltransferase family 4 protein [Patescibacteria group bacterium]MBU0964333.1 glycosyltransferase family 4 protein [Patescibacteria group bacterium]